MDSIVRSCKILVPQLLAGRLILDGYYCVFVLSIFKTIFSNKKGGSLQIVVARFRLRDVYMRPFCSVLSLYILECSECGVVAYSSTANTTNHAGIDCLFYLNSFNFLFRY